MSSAWDSSAFMWTYDEPGGWFDHVPPPGGAAGRYGLRVPALLVSPYARRGHVDSTLLDTTSILRFIEDNWQLRPLPQRDARAGSFAGALDFSRPAREPSLLSGGRGAGGPASVRRWVIYLGYGAALVLAAALIGWAALRRPLVTAPVVALAVVAAAAPAGAQAAERSELPSAIRTVPAVPGMRFEAAGQRFVADSQGRVALRRAVRGAAPGSLRALDTLVAPGVRARFDRWYGGHRIAAVKLYHRVTASFVDPSGDAVDPGVVSSVVLRGSDGGRHELAGERSLWLQGNRVVPESQGTTSTKLHYAAEKVLVAGSNVVHRGQQRFFPAERPAMQIRLLLFAVRVTARDALLGFPIGSAVRLQYPNGGERREALGPRAELTLTSLPRGDYRVGVEALGVSSSRPVALSRDQDVSLRVISWLDVAVVLLGLGSVALALLFARRPAGVRRAGGVSTLLVVLVAVAMAGGAPARAAVPPDPVFAYYYIWFNQGSWNRAKVDYPLLGRYSSDDRDVMRRHVEWAKRAGVDGFIVSWKSTPVLNRRLKRLAEVATAEHFKLLVIYQGLDFEREPLPATRVAHDLDLFRSHYADSRAFDVFAKPLVIWSGTPRFSRADLARVTRRARRSLLVLASERNVRGYRRVADLVDGNAYYWGSVNPETYPGYPKKLADMGRAIRGQAGLWIAPAAPGFDARLVGGRSVVRRRDGATLRAQLDAATQSGPDAVGLISWNEFSENTHVEPSERYGRRYLDVIADVRDASPPELRDFDSSEPAATGVNYGLPLLGGIALFLAGTFLLLVRRGQRRLPPSPDLSHQHHGGAR